MKQTIKKILKEETTDDVEDRFKRSVITLQYILESSLNSNIISEVEINNTNIYRSGFGALTVEAEINIKSYCEDPDINELQKEMNRADEELNKVLKEYNFEENGSIKRIGNRNLSYFLIGVNWDTETYDLNMKYYMMQDEFD